jgi:hypothetical protein
MPGNSVRRPNQPASGPAVGSIWMGIMAFPPPETWTDGPKYRGTNTSSSSRKTCFDPIDSAEAPWSADMIPSPLGRGLPSRHGYGKSF